MATVVDHHVQIAMRDRTLLSADIYRPASAHQCTAVLMRTCYTKALHAHPERGAFWVANGYIYIVQDVRGRGDSDGVFYPLVAERDDGSDTVDWIVSQPWSNGRVVMIGGSYCGWTQVYAGCSQNPHLVSLFPTTTPSDPDLSWPMSRGMIPLAAAGWMATLDGHLNQDLNAETLERALSHHPIIEFDSIMGRRLKPWRDWVNHAVRDRYWEEQAYQRPLLGSSAHMLHVTGWYDDCLSGALENFAALSRRASAAISTQRLLVGPWLHTTIGRRHIGETDFGAAAEIDINRLQLRWFDACATGKWDDISPVQLFVMGRNEWIYENEWPIARTEYVSYFLHSGGQANTRNGDGTLSTLPPAHEPADQFRYDPAYPVPYGAGFDWKQVGGPDDCTTLELRDDILVFTSATFDEPTLICGPLQVRLFAATNARDTDWMAKILDVYPDGKAIRLNDGAVRARFREGHDREIFLPCGTIAEFAIDCWATCIELQPGHRLRLEITSSAFGKYDINLNGGGAIGQEREPVIAQQTVYHDIVHPSRVILPIVRGR